ncbi:MAG TPA: acyl carrier protein [Micromonosporaceae bacterium]|nr:acyl carrier protein [Micromonosporaceae bacterium]
MNPLTTAKDETAQLDGAGLRQRLATAGTAEREQILRETVRTQAAHVLSASDIADDSNFLEKGITSLKALELNRNLMTLTDVEIPLVAIIEYPTPAQLAQYIARALAGNGDGALE